MPDFVGHLVAVAIPILGAAVYLGKQLAQIKSALEGIHEIKAAKLPERMVRVETRLGIQA